MEFSELFVFASFGNVLLSKFGIFFWKKLEFSNSQNFRKKVWKKVRKFKFGEKLGYYLKMYVNFENFKKVRKV